MLAPDDEIEKHPEFQNADSEVIPDPGHYQDWFAVADDDRRRLAVGARRFAAAKQQLGGQTPQWAHFIDPDTGKLLTLDRLKREGAEARGERLSRVNAELAHNAQQKRDVARFGFLPSGGRSETPRPAAPSPPPRPASMRPLPPRSGQLPGGDVVRFLRHPDAGRGEVLVMVDPRKLDAAWQADSMYLPPVAGGASEVQGRRAAFTRFLATGKRVQASRVALDPNGVPGFTDGRHRFSVLRDLGTSAVGVMVPRSQADEVRRRFGV